MAEAQTYLQGHEVVLVAGITVEGWGRNTLGNVVDISRQASGVVIVLPNPPYRKASRKLVIDVRMIRPATPADISRHRRWCELVEAGDRLCDMMTNMRELYREACDEAFLWKYEGSSVDDVRERADAYASAKASFDDWAAKMAVFQFEYDLPAVVSSVEEYEP